MELRNQLAVLDPSVTDELALLLDAAATALHHLGVSADATRWDTGSWVTRALRLRLSRFEDWHIPDGRADTAEQLAEELRVVLVMVSRARHGIVITRARSLISKSGNPYATRESQWWPIIVEACPMNANTLVQHISELVS